ncbi:MAG TPA: hypothetical protein VIK18_21520 [Pirellulales bacterium]
MGLSLLSCSALALVLYFGWALVDPQTLKEVEDRVARSSSTTATGVISLRVRNGLGLLFGLVLFVTSVYRDLTFDPSNKGRPEPAASRTLPTPAIHDKSLLDRIDNATLQRQIEHQQNASRESGP